MVTLELVSWYSVGSMPGGKTHVAWAGRQSTRAAHEMVYCKTEKKGLFGPFCGRAERAMAGSGQQALVGWWST